MTELTEERKLEITEGIVQAMPFTYNYSFIGNETTIVEVENVGGTFEDYDFFNSWNDAMRAADALGVDLICMDTLQLPSEWAIKLCVSPVYEGEGLHPSKLVAFVLALHEIAKAKLEESK